MDASKIERMVGRLRYISIIAVIASGFGSLLMYMTVAPGGLVGFDWILLGLGVFADVATYMGGYRERTAVPYGETVP